MTTTTSLRRKVDCLIAEIDRTLNRHVNAILHHPRFQSLEASWRGVWLLLEQPHQGGKVIIRLLDARWVELVRDTERAADFDQSHLFDLVYNREFGMAGGTPFGLLVGDYMLEGPSAGGSEISSALQAIATTAAAAFCPFIASAGPGILGLHDFSDLSRLPDISSLRQSVVWRRWEAMRAHEDMRFVGLVAPRILIRSSHPADTRERTDCFMFRENLDKRGKNLLWGNGALAFAIVVIRSFSETGWFADMRGLRSEQGNGGLLSAAELPPYDMDYESAGLSAQPPVEVRLTASQEQALCDCGLIPVCCSYMSADLVFNSNQSLHIINHYRRAEHSENAQLAAMLQHVLCVSRFAHYIKIIMRQTIGQNKDAPTIEKELLDWLSGYTLGNSDADPSMRALYPLRSVKVSVQEAAGCPGMYVCAMQFQPHFQLDGIQVSFQVISEPLLTRPPLSGYVSERPAGDRHGLNA